MKVIESREALQTWDDYQEFLKAQLKLMDGAGAPFFISKEKVRFESAGKTWNGHAVLAGPKGPVCARKLQQEGVLFREGTCSKDGKELRVDGLDTKLVREAAKTLAKLLQGYKITGVEDEAGGEPATGASATSAPAGAAAEAPSGKGGAGADLAKQASKIAKAVEIWSMTEAAATKELRKLQKALLALDDPRSKPVIQGLESILARIDKVDDEARAVQAAAGNGDEAAFGKARADFIGRLDGIRAHVEQDELIRLADSFPQLEVRIRETFTKSLTQLIKAI